MGDAAGSGLLGAVSCVDFYNDSAGQYKAGEYRRKRWLSFGNTIYGEPMHGKGAWDACAGDVKKAMMTRAMMRCDEPAGCVQPLHKTKSSFVTSHSSARTPRSCRPASQPASSPFIAT